MLFRSAEQLSAKNLTVILDDRAGVSPGVRFKDAELIGTPCIVIAGRGVANGVVEVRNRRSGSANEVAIDEVGQVIDKMPAT